MNTLCRYLERAIRALTRATTARGLPFSLAHRFDEYTMLQQSRSRDRVASGQAERPMTPATCQTAKEET